MQALLARVFHGKIGGDEGKDALGVPHRNGAGDHPDLSASHIKIGRRPDARVGGQWRRDPSMQLNVVVRHGKVQCGVAVGGAIDIETGRDSAVLIQQGRSAAVERGVGIQVGPQAFPTSG